MRAGAASTPPPADRPGIPSEVEPVTSFHPLTAGAAVPGPVQPMPGPGPRLEEEPALWPDLGPGPRPPDGASSAGAGFPSKAPMSHPAPRDRAVPRWSVAGQPAPVDGT
jgi:hypothetical protein